MHVARYKGLVCNVLSATLQAARWCWFVKLCSDIYLPQQSAKSISRLLRSWHWLFWLFWCCDATTYLNKKDEFWSKRNTATRLVACKTKLYVLLRFSSVCVCRTRRIWTMNNKCKMNNCVLIAICYYIILAGLTHSWLPAKCVKIRLWCPE